MSQVSARTTRPAASVPPPRLTERLPVSGYSKHAAVV
jgi:hypothetical protein